MFLAANLSTNIHIDQQLHHPSRILLYFVSWCLPHFQASLPNTNQIDHSISSVSSNTDTIPKSKPCRAHFSFSLLLYGILNIHRSWWWYSMYCLLTTRFAFYFQAYISRLSSQSRIDVNTCVGMPLSLPFATSQKSPYIHKPGAWTITILYVRRITSGTVKNLILSRSNIGRQFSEGGKKWRDFEEFWRADDRSIRWETIAT